MNIQRTSTILFGAGCIFAALTGCSNQSSDKAGSAEREKSFAVSADNVIARASQSRSIVFPLSVQISDPLPGFTKVYVKNSKELDPEALSFAVYSCSFYEISWFDSTSHWKAIVSPSASSDLFKEERVNHFTDKEMIDCVSKYYSQTFFYQVQEKGYDTYPHD